MAETRRLYQAQYRTELENETTHSGEPTTQDAGDSNTSPNDLASTPEEGSWKKRYGDLRSHSNSLTERIRSLETQLQDANKKEFKLPSSPQEMDAFRSRYPDVFRYMETIAMQQILNNSDVITSETKKQQEELETVKRELGYKKILSAHPDFEEINLSEAFHEWARTQPEEIQKWLFESSDPVKCIKALDIYKAETEFKKARTVQPRPRQGADTLVQSRSNVALADDSGKKVWKASEIEKMHPKLFEQHEADIEAARAQGRIDLYA